MMMTGLAVHRVVDCGALAMRTVMDCEIRSTVIGGDLSIRSTMDCGVVTIRSTVVGRGSAVVLGVLSILSLICGYLAPRAVLFDKTVYHDLSSAKRWKKNLNLNASAALLSS